jgi:ABC-type multidrug transport system fused ATPase/permease subunit
VKKYFEKHKGLFILTLILSVAASLFNVIISVVLQVITDNAISGDLSGFLKTMQVTLIYIALLGFITFFTSLIANKLINKIIKSIREKIFTGIINRGHAEFHKAGTADYMSALINDVKLLEENYLVQLLTLIQCIIIFIASVSVMFYFDVIVALCVLGAIMLMFVIPGLFGSSLQKRQELYSNSLSNITNDIKDLLSGFEVVKSYGLKGFAISRFALSNDKTFKTKYAVDRIQSANEGVSAILGVLIQISSVLLSAYFIIIGRMSMGDLMGILAASGLVVQPLTMIFQSAPLVKSARPIIKRLDDFAEYQDVVVNEISNPTYEKQLVAEEIRFSYDGTKEILCGASIVFNKGKKYALVGRNGCGKSTLAKILCGYFTDYQGKVFYDNLDISKLSYDELAKLSAIIHQNVYIFNESVLDNICLHHQYSEAEIEEALIISGVSGFVSELPQGINTLAEENGANFSGGQKQRIVVARAIIQGKPILVLDEGTSAVDMQTAYDIENKLLKHENLTLLTITHNLNAENLKRFDQIVYMDNGVVTETGTYQELVDKKGGFYGFSRLNESKN